MGTSLMVQWLCLHTPNAGDLGSTPGQGTRSHMSQLRVHVPQLIHSAAKKKNKKAGNIPEIATPEEVSRCKKTPKQENPWIHFHFPH